MMKKLAVAAALATTLAATGMGAAPAEAGWKKHHFKFFKIKVVKHYDCYWKKIKIYDDYYGWHWVKVKICDY
jgi:hypothetical protein